MTIFINNKSTKFCQITLRIKRFIDKRKVVPFFRPHGVHPMLPSESRNFWDNRHKLPLTALAHSSHQHVLFTLIYNSVHLND